MLAVAAIAAVSAVAGAKPVGCESLFRNQHMVSYAAKVYAGTQDATRAELAQIAHEEHCARFPATVWWVRRYVASLKRKHDARAIWSSALASWFDDAGGTACGFHAALGVANTSLPCGTRVTFKYGGREAVGVVEDRGPYVEGRVWDLNPGLRDALGFDGVGVVQYRVG